MGGFPGCVADRYKIRSLIVHPAARDCLCAGAGWLVFCSPGPYGLDGLKMLERRTDMRLIARSTRHLALTEEGQALYDRAQRILAEVDEAEAALTHGRVEPQGVLRVSAPVALGRAHVSPVCRDLVRTHPKVSVDLTLSDRLVELIDEGMDSSFGSARRRTPA
jgi:DNA-binding transcriptional LysR family regulator